MLHWKTVNHLLKQSLDTIMRADVFLNFRLVGGTALSLHLGHRMSVDIDLFTDAPYGSIDFVEIDDFLVENFAYTDATFSAMPANGKSYLIGDNENEVVKLDVYYTNDPFM